jgi:hypothetical protein
MVFLLSINWIPIAGCELEVAPSAQSHEIFCIALTSRDAELQRLCHGIARQKIRLLSRYVQGLDIGLGPKMGQHGASTPMVDRCTAPVSSPRRSEHVMFRFAQHDGWKSGLLSEAKHDGWKSGHAHPALETPECYEWHLSERIKYETSADRSHTA